MTPVTLLPPRRLLLSAALAFLPGVAAAQLSGASPATQATCRTALAAPAPAAPAGGPLRPAQLRSCDSTALYFGLGQPRDVAAALQCGWFQRAHPEPSLGNSFRGPGVLSMIYANGDGVPRDLDLATRFVCENDWAAPAELDGRIEHLARIREALATHTSPPDLHFDLCDDATSGLSMGTCTAIQTRRAEDTRRTQIDALVRSLPAPAQQRFPALRAAERHFEATRAGYEVDLSGSGRAAFQLEEQNTLAQQFLINLQRLRTPSIPAATPAELASLRQQLAQALARVHRAPASHWQGTTITPVGIDATQQSYAALTRAWLGFAPLAFPQITPAALEAQLLRLRLHQLHSLLR